MSKTPAQKIDGGMSVAEMWEGFRDMVFPDAPAELHEMMRGSFYAGGYALFNWFMVQLEEGDEATPTDLNRVSLLEAELRGFFEQERPQA